MQPWIFVFRYTCLLKKYAQFPAAGTKNARRTSVVCGSRAEYLL